MYMVDTAGETMEHYMASVYDWMVNFNSAEFTWRLKRTSMAEWRERFRYKEQRDLKAAQGDQVSQMMLMLDKLEDDGIEGSEQMKVRRSK